MNIPQGYKQTALGIIPEDWEIKKILQIGAVVTGSTPPRNITEYWNGNFHWVSAIDFSSKYIRKTNETLTNLGRKQCRVIPEGSVLVTCIASIGLNAIVTTECATNQQINAVICNNNVYNEYIYYQICNQKRALLLLAGQTAVPIISKSEFQDFAIAIPSNIEEQRKIAAALSDVDALIAALDKKIAKKRFIKQGAMQQLLTGKKRLQGFTDKWESVKLRTIINVNKGEQINKSQLSDYIGYPVMNGGIYSSGFYRRYNCDADTIIISEGGNSCGFVNYMSHRFWAGGHCYIVISQSNVSIKYLYLLLKANEETIMGLRTGSGLPNIQKNRLLNDIEIYLAPNLEEQQAIAAILSDMDKEIADLEARRDKYKLVKSGMMQKLLTGQIRSK